MNQDKKGKAGRAPRQIDRYYTDTIEEVFKPKFVELCEHMLWLSFNADSHKVQREATQYSLDRVLGKPAQEIIEFVQGDQRVTIERVPERSQEEIDKFIEQAADSLSTRDVVKVTNI